MCGARSAGKFQSTHPCAGCDLRHHHGNPRRGHFNPRTPARGATSALSARHTRGGISIHAPLRGVRRMSLIPIDFIRRISIHAPLRGVRRGRIKHDFLTVRNFNPRTPARGATKADGSFVAIQLKFQSTHPCAGCDGIFRFLAWLNAYFNPRTPARGATIHCTNGCA